VSLVSGELLLELGYVYIVKCLGYLHGMQIKIINEIQNDALSDPVQLRFLSVVG
jgi:hypothetical protein